MKQKLLTAGAGLLCMTVMAESLPDDYIPLEYLRSTGTQYIDSGYKLSSASRVDADFTVNEKCSSCFYGINDPNDETKVHFAYEESNRDRWMIAVGNAYANWLIYSSGEPGILGPHRFTINDWGSTALDGVSRWRVPLAFQSSFNAFIFARNDNTGGPSYPAKIDLRAFDIYESGALVRSYRPALRVRDRAQGLFESKEGKFYENAGKGSFATPNFIRVTGLPAENGRPSPDYGYVYDRTEGLDYVYCAPKQVGTQICTGWRFVRLDGTVRQGLGEKAVLNFSAADAGGVLEWFWGTVATGGLPEGYLPLEYLRSTGTQYIDSGYKLSSGSRVDADFTVNEKCSSCFYGINDPNDETKVHFAYEESNRDRWMIAVGNAYSKWLIYSSGEPGILGPHRFTINDWGSTVLDGVGQWRDPLTFQSSFNAFIFARNDNTGGPSYPAKIDLRAFDIYENGLLARSFRPAFRQSDRTAGLYESVTGQFFGNAGTETFEPTGGYVRIAGEPADYGTVEPAYGCASGRNVGTEYVYRAPLRCRTAARGSSASCRGWRFTRLDGTQLTGSGNEVRLVHTAADDGGTLEWIWEETVKSFGSVNRSVITVADSALGTGASVADFPLLVRVSPERIEGFDYAQCVSGAASIWFSDSPSGLTALPVDVDEWNPEGESLFWVKLPELKSGVRLYMFWGEEYGRPSAAGSVWGDHVAVWHFNSVTEGGFTDATERQYRLYSDSSVPELDGAVSVIGKAKKGGGTLSFDDYQSRIEAFAGGRGMVSLSGWFLAPETASAASYYLYPFMAYSRDKTPGWYFETTSACAAKMAWYDGTFMTTSNFGISDIRKDWMHVAVVFNQAGKGWQLYVNGVQVKYANSGTLDAYENAPLQIVFDRVDELRVRACASSADWISAEYAQGSRDNLLVYGPRQVYVYEKPGFSITVK